MNSSIVRNLFGKPDNSNIVLKRQNVEFWMRAERFNANAPLKLVIWRARVVITDDDVMRDADVDAVRLS